MNFGNRDRNFKRIWGFSRMNFKEILRIVAPFMKEISGNRKWICCYH